MYNKGRLMLFGVLLFLSCKKETIEFDPIPSIEIVSVSPGSVTEYTQAVTITIKYTDGDGDLGENTSGVKNCFVTDNRIGITSGYRIQQLAPASSSVPITGTINIDIGGQGITDTSLTSQNVSFNVYVVDRQGHSSNTVSTSAISIHR
ncbi:MAG TPA: hypothetical protein PKK99_06445 [Bacteroidia bacterium]|nr:hypothetical protein [Bacteroidia bacterium]